MIQTALHKAYTFASHTSPVTIQSLQKSMLSPALRKNKKSPRIKKNKTLPAHSQTDKNGMTEPNDNQQGMSHEQKEGLLVTKCSSNKGFRGNSSILPRSKFGVV